jgi:hypothetical protein
MSILKDFWADKRGSGIQTLAISAAVIGLASVAASSALEKFAQAGGFPTIAFIDSHSFPAPGSGGKAPVFNNVDTSATASINRPVILDPCTGKQKN